MPLKLIGTIILLLIVTVFCGVNMDNKCDISFVFTQFEQVPVFVTVIISFAIGAILMLPFTLGLGRKKKNDKTPAPADGKKTEEQTKTENTEKESKTLFDFKIKKETPKTEKKADEEK